MVRFFRIQISLKILFFLPFSIFLLKGCSFNDIGFSKNSEDDKNLIIGLLIGNYISSLADAKVSGIAIYFEDPDNRQQSAMRANQLTFAPISNLPVSTIINTNQNVEKNSTLSKQTVIYSSEPNEKGEFSVFLKWGYYRGNVLDLNGIERGAFYFHLKNEEGIPLIADKNIPNTLYIRISASKIGTSGTTEDSGGAGSIDIENEGESSPELFN